MGSRRPSASLPLCIDAAVVGDNPSSSRGRLDLFHGVRVPPPWCSRRGGKMEEMVLAFPSAGNLLDNLPEMRPPSMSTTCCCRPPLRPAAGGHLPNLQLTGLSKSWDPDRWASLLVIVAASGLCCRKMFPFRCRISTYQEPPSRQGFSSGSLIQFICLCGSMESKERHDIDWVHASAEASNIMQRFITKTLYLEAGNIMHGCIKKTLCLFDFLLAIFVPGFEVDCVPCLINLVVFLQSELSTSDFFLYHLHTLILFVMNWYWRHKPVFLQSFCYELAYIHLSDY